MVFAFSPCYQRKDGGLEDRSSSFEGTDFTRDRFTTLKAPTNIMKAGNSEQAPKDSAECGHVENPCTNDEALLVPATGGAWTIRRGIQRKGRYRQGV